MPLGDSGAPFMNPLADQQTETCMKAANPIIRACPRTVAADVRRRIFGRNLRAGPPPYVGGYPLPGIGYAFDTMSKARRHKGLSEIEEIPRTDFDPCKHIAPAQFQWDRVSGSHVA